MLDFQKLPQFFKTCYRLEARMRPDTLVPFAPNSAQLDFLDICRQVQEQRQLLRIVAIKPRRVGLSRVVSGIGCTMMYTNPSMNGRIMAHLGNTLDAVFKSVALMIKGVGQPYHHDITANRIELGSGKSKSIMFGSKALASGEGRGDAALFMQLTEAAYYPIKSPFTAMLPLVPKSRESFVAIESTPTPERTGVAFKEMWENARWVSERRRDAEFVRYFCPWMKDPYALADKETTESVKDDAPIDEEERILMRAGVDIRRIAWRRREIRSTYRGRKELFEMENPSDPQSCFLQGEMPAFSLEEKAWAVESIVEPTHARLVATKDRNQPVEIREEDNGVWRIYESPQKKCEYYIGVDAARGFDGITGNDREVTDFAAVVVLNGSTCAVAAVLEARMPPDRVAREVFYAGQLYRTLEISEFHFALLNVAITDGFGNEIQRRLINEYEYPIHRFLRWHGRDDRTHRRAGTNIGWVDTVTTNEMRVNALRDALYRKQLVVRDRRFAEQIQSASMSKSGDAEDTRGHDDVLDAGMYAWIARDLNKPRTVMEPEETETAHSRAMFRMANDPDAFFARFNREMTSMIKPPQQNRVERMLNYINEGKDGYENNEVSAFEF